MALGRLYSWFLTSLPTIFPAGSRDPVDTRACWVGEVKGVGRQGAVGFSLMISITLLLPTHCALKHLISLLLLP